MENISGRIFLQGLLGSSFFQSGNDAFCGLDLFTDQVLAASSTSSFELPENTYIVVLPVTGVLIYNDNKGSDDLEVDAGQTLIISSTAPFKIRLENPFAEHEINFLLFRLNTAEKTQPLREVINFEFNNAHNKLNNILPGVILPFKLSIGQFQGRQETLYTLHHSGIFCFVLSGAFEVQGRLLHAKDALALWNISEVEIEALSNNSTILILELPYI